MADSARPSRPPPDETRSAPPTWRGLLAMGAALGLGYGYLEALQITAMGAVPGLLAWRTGNAPHVLWFAPAFYALAGLVAALPFSLLLACGARYAARTGMVFAFLAGGAFLALAPAEGRLAPWARVAFAIGVGVHIAGWYRRREQRSLALLSRSTPLLAAGVPAMCLLAFGHQVASERLALSRLTSAASPAPPNVLLLVLDTQRADHLSAYGYHRPTTPNIDRLASEGVLFEHAMAPSSWTLPSHASLFTGRLPQEHRAGILRRPYLDGSWPTLAERFQSGGYATGAFVANGFWCGRQTGLDRGFIRYEDFYGNPGDAIVRTALGRIIGYQLLPRLGWHDLPGRKWANRINADFLAWVDGVEARPFFAFLNYMDVHDPLLPPAPYAGRFAQQREEREGTGIEIGAITGDMPDMPAAELQRRRNLYDESLLFLDAQIGALMDQLRRRSLLDNTVVVLTSDHGESFGEHGMVFHGHSLYREQLHVPLIVRHPASARAGVRIEEPVGAQRLAATLLAQAGLPRDRFPGVPLPLTGTDDAPFRPVIGGVGRRSMLPADWPASRGWLTSVFLESRHLILSEDGRVELYDLHDRGELRNLATDARLSGTASALQQLYGVAWTSPEAAGQLRTVSR